MKLASWNVNGLRAALRGGLVEWLESERPEVVCLQEVKAHPDQLQAEVLARLGYRAYWHPADRPGYSGVATLCLGEPTRVEIGLGRGLFDREGRVLLVELCGLALVNAYFPSSRRDHTRLDFKLAFCRAIAHRLGALRRAGERAVLCGDYNIAHREIDLAHPERNQNNAGFLPEERAWLDRFLARGWIDAFRQRCPDGGHYTWWSYRPGVRQKNVGWRIDYFCLDEALEPRLVRAHHDTHVLGSDHCPVRVELDV